MSTPHSNHSGAAASALRDKADALPLRDKADALPGAEAVKGAAHATAHAIDSTAEYIRDNDKKSMWADLMRLVKGNPGVSLLTAAAVGFLIARKLSRD
jgi:ElaB/YqjD/DUF883 family membrane-anchored ribosome-binding protein